MDYQFACVVQFLVFCSALNYGQGIIGRDLVLTPKQGLQINGKSIYYADESAGDLRNRTASPWERTLKHVTFVTLFTNAAAEAVAGNLSKLREYNNFLQSPYIRQDDANSGRFGDIVTLASGRVEEENNHTYRFIEGACNYQCAEDRVIALWQVQKIRHRDLHRTFRYEMKYSISPMRIQSYNGATAETNADSGVVDGGGDIRQQGYQAYIQKDDDYPQSFGYLNYADEEQHFADRRFDAEGAERSFRQVPSTQPYNDYRQATPMPQSTFLSGNFLPPPPPPPQINHDDRHIADRLNIGEYIKHYVGAKATPKIELFPNSASRMGFSSTATTFRPNYNFNFAKPPEVIFHPPPPPPQHTKPQQFPIKFPENSHEILAYDNKLNKQMVTHHFHHHFFMPPGGGNENSIGGGGGAGSAEQQLRSPISQYKQEVVQVTPAYYGNSFQDEQQKRHLIPPAPQKISFPLPSSELAGDEQPQLQQQELVHVTPVPPLRKPQIYQMFPVSIGAKIPLFIYPAPINDDDGVDEVEQTVRSSSSNTNKPFIQSEPLDLGIIRYSEPDPLYINGSPQLEIPPNLQQFDDNGHAVVQPNEIESTGKQNQTPDSIAAQLPPPAEDQDIQVPYVEDETQEDETTAKQDQAHEHSIKDAIKITTEKNNSSTVGTTEATSTVATTNSNETLAASSTEHTKTAASNEISTRTRSNFVSTSTMTTPLRMLTRGRVTHAARTTTTTTTTSATEKPVLKWKPRRKLVKANEAPQHMEAHGSAKREDKQIDSAFGRNVSSTTTLSPPIKNSQQNNNEVFEVLTQKSVSKSVSFKVGGNGEEIQIIEDDNENKVEKT